MKSWGSLHVIGMCMGNDNEVNGGRIDFKRCEPLFYMTEQVAVSRVDEDAFPVVDKVAVAVVLPVILPDECVQTFKDFPYHILKSFLFIV